MMTLIIIFYFSGGATSERWVHNVPAIQCKQMAQLIINNGNYTGAFCQPELGAK